MPDPASHTAAGITIGAFGWVSTAMFGNDATFGVLMMALIGSLMAQARYSPCMRWNGYVIPVVGYSIFSLALTQIAIVSADHFLDMKIGAVAPALAFMLAFFRYQLIKAFDAIIERLPDLLGKKEG